MRVLNIISSPRSEKSVSIAIAATFIDSLRQRIPGITIDTLNIWEEKLPEFDRSAVGTKYKRLSNEPMDHAEQIAWAKIEKLVERFQSADRIIIGVPMWNFGCPYKLKQLIDLVSLRNMLFTFDGQTYSPLLDIPRALAIHVRGQSQAADGTDGWPGFEYQSGYIEFWLRFIGSRVVDKLMIEHTWDGLAQENIERAKRSAVELAAHF